MTCDDVFRPTNQLGHATFRTGRQFVTELERPARHGDSHREWGVPVELPGSGQQRRWGQMMAEATWPGFRREGSLPDGPGLLAIGRIQKQHELVTRKIVRHLWRELLGGDDLNLGVVPEMLFQGVGSMAPYRVVSTQQVPETDD